MGDANHTLLWSLWWQNSKQAIADDVLPDGTVVKKGWLLGYVPYSMGRMKFIWGADALEFKPDRWLKNGIYQPESPFKFTAFQVSATY
jgi:cytochrome P450